jgi:glyoxylase-like metal-dependent hydrolase (beta-lactamase superfamily II)/rhodanese-related sulfurtransferase
MVLRQYYLGCLAQASYLVGDEGTGRAVIVDPRRDIELYLDEARSLGLIIEDVLLTHFHADFVSGHLELRERTGCRIRLGRRARADYSFVPVGDGDVLELGAVRLEILETPGHTPEAISILVFDGAQGPGRPRAVLTGDALFVGDVGRPDLLASSGTTADALARELYRSLRQKLLALPDETLVYPAHGAGSLCGRSLGQETVTTIGEQRRENYALQPMAEDEFVRLVTTDQPDPPAYFAHDAALNMHEHPTLSHVMDRELTPLRLAEVLELRASGAQLLDVREPRAFAAGHLAGSVNIGLSGKYATWAGTLLDRERAIVIVAERGREEEAVIRLGRIGLDQVAGYLEDGVAALADRDDLLAVTVRLSASELAERLATERPPLVVDVRAAAERAQQRLEGSVHVPLTQLARRERDLPRDRELVMMCASGYRSCIAASVLERDGFPGVADLAGGMAAWAARRAQQA